MRNLFILLHERYDGVVHKGIFDSLSDAYDHIANDLKLVSREKLEESPFLTMHSLCMHTVQVPYHQSRLSKINTWLEL